MLQISIKISPLPRVLYRQTFILPKEAPLASGSFPWRNNGKNAVDPCDGIGLGMLSEGHHLKRDDLLKDIPDNKAFFSCARGCAKSHLK